MKTTAIAPITAAGLAPSEKHSIAELLAPLEQLAAKSSHLMARPVGKFERKGRSYEIPRYIFLGPQGGDVTIPIGIFAGIHGDEPEGAHALVKLVQLLEAHPELATGYCLFLYPLCNPTGFENGTAFSSRGKDVNLELLKISAEPEAQLLQEELRSQPLEGIIKLHTKADSGTFYGLVRGETLARQLLDPALAAAAELLPVADDARIEGFRARDVSYDHYEGGVTDSPQAPTRPFEVILETPGQVPAYLREWAFVLALRSILTEYRKFLAYAPNL